MSKRLNTKGGNGSSVISGAAIPQSAADLFDDFGRTLMGSGNDLTASATVHEHFMDATQAGREGHFLVNTDEQTFDASSDAPASTLGNFSDAVSSVLQTHSLDATDTNGGGATIFTLDSVPTVMVADNAPGTVDAAEQTSARAVTLRLQRLATLAALFRVCCRHIHWMRPIPTLAARRLSLALDSAPTPTVADNAPGFAAAPLAGAESAVGQVSSATMVVDAGATQELANAYSGTVSFAGTTGTLLIDHASSFTGTITGQLGIGNIIDLADIAAGPNLTISYSGNDSPGTLTVSDGVHTANIALDGDYSLANFTAYSDGHGGTAIMDPPTYVGTGLDANGWTTFASSADTRTIYVSSSTGNDANNGLSPNSAVATIAEGLSLIRDGSADHLLLKAGDTFVDQSFGWLNISGRSGTEPILISSYGTGARPLIETPANSDVAIGAFHGSAGSNLAIVGLDFYDYTRDPSNPHYAGQGTGDQGGNVFYKCCQ